MSMHHTGIEIKPTFRLEFDPSTMTGVEIFEKVIEIRDKFNKEFENIKDHFQLTAQQPNAFTICVAFDRGLNTSRMIDFHYSEKKKTWKLWFQDSNQPPNVRKWVNKCSKFDGKILHYVVDFVDHKMMP